jgi:hypothetical protein
VGFKAAMEKELKHIDLDTDALIRLGGIYDLQATKEVC